MKHQKIIIIAVVFIIIYGALSFLNARNAEQNDNNEAISDPKTINQIKDSVPFSYEMKPLNNSNQTGKADLTTLIGGKTKVVIDVNQATTSAQPAYIREGDCTSPSETGILLSSLRSGRSETIIEYSLPELTEKPHSIVLSFGNHMLFTYSSCAEIRK